MRNGLLAAIIRRTAIGNVRFVVLEPRVNRTALLLHLSAEHSHIAAVIDDVVPVLFEHLPYLHALGINHQSARVTVEAMNHMSRAGEVALAEVLVEDGLDAVLPRSGGHAEDAFGLLDDDKVLVLIDYLDELVQEFRASLVAAHENRLPGREHEVVLRDELPIDLNAVSLQQVLHPVAADSAHLLH